MSILPLAYGGRSRVHTTYAAGIADRVQELSKETIRDSFSDFENVEHRLEFVANVDGVDFINDSKATNVNSAWYALECMVKPVVWIVGGTDKGNDYSPLFDLVHEKVTHVVCLGKDNAKIHRTFGHLVATLVDVDSAALAVRWAYDLSEPGGTVLLSPACASFDLFENYEDRGRQFKTAVRAL